MDALPVWHIRYVAFGMSRCLCSRMSCVHAIYIYNISLGVFSAELEMLSQNNILTWCRDNPPLRIKFAVLRGEPTHLSVRQRAAAAAVANPNKPNIGFCLSRRDAGRVSYTHFNLRQNMPSTHTTKDTTVNFRQVYICPPALEPHQPHASSSSSSSSSSMSIAPRTTWISFPFASVCAVVAKKKGCPHHHMQA